MFVEDAADPDAGGRLEIGAANHLAVEILRRLDSGRRVDEDKAVTKSAMQEDRNGGERLALVADHEIGADILLADVELVLAAHAPVAFARSHVGEKNEVEAVGLHRSLFERAHDVIVAARHRQCELAHLSFPGAQLNRANARNAARRGARSR